MARTGTAESSGHGLLATRLLRRRSARGGPTAHVVVRTRPSAGCSQPRQSRVVGAQTPPVHRKVEVAERARPGALTEDRSLPVS